MITRITIACISLLAFVYTTSASAQGLVECPADQVDARVTTKLPGDWWSTPSRGPLVGTEVAKIGADLTLVCRYEVLGTVVSVMRKAPGNMGCAARPTGFECSNSMPQQESSSTSSLDVKGGFKIDPAKVLTDNSVKVQGGSSAASPGSVKVGTNTPSAGNANTGKGPSVSYGGSCSDPMLNGIEVRYLSVEPARNQYSFRLVAVVENAGRANYTSSPKQQVLELHTIPQGGSARRLRSWDFPSIPAGGEAAESIYDIGGWKLSDEFPPSYRFSITYGPDISSDGNNSNDDCDMSNNSATISGADIMAIIRASGI